ncbi:SDR family NAD(P)-dependent oxidoreductase [Ligilactobacillus sp. LYQ135]
MSQNIIKNRFKDKVIIITGAAGGIGKATAIRAAKEGAKLILADKKEEMSHETLAEIQNITPNVRFMVADLTKEENCKKLVDLAVDTFGTIDILVNNAGITGTPAPVDQMPPSMFKLVIETNIFIAYYMSHYAIPVMKQNDEGAVINVASVAGLTGFPGHSAYVTSKHGLNGLTRNMALDYASDHIRVNSVNPGTTATPMLDEAMEFLKNKRQKAAQNGDESGQEIVSGKTTSPQNRVARADEVADVILFLASDEASNMTGVFVPVDGGFTAF